MKELFYYFIFAIILYFILTTVFDNLEQENFDSSLIPVSSIVTLAKVAQKLVNINGTLINPGNLQIGVSATDPSNLTVTGNSTTGSLSVTGTTTFTGPITFGSGNSNFPGNLSMAESITVGSSSNAQPIQTWGSITSKNLTVGPGSIQFNGPINLGAKLIVDGSIVQDRLNIQKGSAFPDSTIFGFGDGAGWKTRFGKPSSPTLDVYDNGNVIINGSTNITGTLTSNNYNVETKLTIGGVDILDKIAKIRANISSGNSLIQQLESYNKNLVKLGDKIYFRRVADNSYIHGNRLNTSRSEWTDWKIHFAENHPGITDPHHNS
jgi:hypothetical protein